MPIFCAHVSCLTLVSAWHHGPLLPPVQDRDDTILRLRAVVASRFAGKVAMAPPQVHRSDLGQRAVSIHQGYKVLTHCHISPDMIVFVSATPC